jgi:flagellar hook-associated protein 3 FlgL
MRVTEHTNYDTVRDSIQRSKGRMEQLQLQQSTLKKINTPSDDPVGSAKVLEMRTDKVNNDQLQMNSKLAEAYLNNTDHALSQLSDIVLRAKEIAIGQSSGASSTDSTRLGVAEEVTQLFAQAVAAANTRVADRYLFGGYKTDRPPVSEEGQYKGDAGKMMVEIAKDVYLTMNIPGFEAFNTSPDASNDAQRVYGPEGSAQGTRRTPAREEGEQRASAPENINVFGELQNLRISLLTGDLDGIRNTLERFDQMHSKLNAERAKVGSRIQGLQSASESLERHNLTNAQLSSQLEDADMAQVVTDLAKEETVFRSSLASSQKLIQPTLLDFLK